MNYSPNISIMVKAARKASRILLRDFGEVANLQISEKGTNDFVTNADFKSEKIIMDELDRDRPGYSFLSEEAGEIKSESEYRWIIDPLDGTVNYLHALPFFCISLALEKTLSNGNKEIIAAVIEAPALGETYVAEKGQGAWLESHGNSLVNRTRLRVSSRRDINHSLISLGFNLDNKNDSLLLEKLSRNNLHVRMMGSTALSLAYIAAGKHEVYLKKYEKYWDVAAGMLIVKEAGGIISDINNNDHISSENGIIATNQNIRKNFIDFIS